MWNYFKVFTTKRNPDLGPGNGASRRIDAHEVFPFDDASPKDTAEAFGRATDFASLVAYPHISVYRHPRCSKAWDDVRVIGISPLYVREYHKAEITVAGEPLPAVLPVSDYVKSCGGGPEACGGCDACLALQFPEAKPATSFRDATPEERAEYLGPDPE